MAEHRDDVEYRNVPRDEHYTKQKYTDPVVRDLGTFPSHGKDKARKYYRPTIIETPSILALLFVILGLVGLVEFACRASPTENLQKQLSMAGATLNIRSAPLPSSQSVASQSISSPGSSPSPSTTPASVFPTSSVKTAETAYLPSSPKAVDKAASSSTTAPPSASGNGKSALYPSTTNYLPSNNKPADSVSPTPFPSVSFPSSQPGSNYLPPTTKSVDTVKSPDGQSTTVVHSVNHNDDAAPDTTTTRVAFTTTGQGVGYLPSVTRGVEISTSSNGKSSYIVTTTSAGGGYLPPTTRTADKGSSTYAVASPSQSSTQSSLAGGGYLPPTTNRLAPTTKDADSKPPQSEETKTVNPDKNLPPDTNSVGREPLKATPADVGGAGDSPYSPMSLPASKSDGEYIPTGVASVGVVNIPGPNGDGRSSPPVAAGVTVSDGQSVGALFTPGGPNRITTIAPGATPFAALASGAVFTTTDAKGNAVVATAGAVFTTTDANGKAIVATVGALLTTTDANGNTVVATVGVPSAVKSVAGSSGGRPTISPVPVASLRAGTLFTTTDAQGNTIVATAGVTQYVTKLSTDAKGHVHTQILIQGSVTVSTSTDSTGGVHRVTKTGEPTQTAITSGPNRVNRPVHNLTAATYFLGSYLPVLLAILLRITAGMVYAAIKMLEPFYTLANHDGGGALAKDFLNINYLATDETFDPFIALFKGHWLMLFTTILYLAIASITPFASEFATLAYFCNSENLCGPELRVKPIIGRVLQALLIFSAVMLIAFLLLLRKFRSGVFADPSSIASMATLLHHPQVVEDFQKLDPNISKKQTEKILSSKRYCLDYYKTKDGSERYGIVALQHEAMGVAGGSRDTYDPLSNPEAEDDASSIQTLQKKKRKHHTFRVIRDTALGLVTAGILIIIVWYYKNSDQNNTFERFIDAQDFGPRFVFSMFGLLIHSQWKRIEREVCIIQPFRCLAEGSASAHSSILIRRTLNPLTTFVISIPRRHVYCALVALTSLLAEVLIVTLAGVPFNAGQLLIAFKISAYISIGILCCMLIMLVVVYARPRGPALPRTPNTVGAVFSYLCASPLMEDFADLAVLPDRKKRRRVIDMGRKYILEVVEGVDGKARWQVTYDNSGLDPS